MAFKNTSIEKKISLWKNDELLPEKPYLIFANVFFYWLLKSVYKKIYTFFFLSVVIVISFKSYINLI